MRHYLFGVVLLVSACAAVDPFSLSIVHTNDIHAHILPFDKDGKECKSEDAHCSGGMAAIAGAISVQREKDPDTVVLDAGDRFTGTLFYTLHKGRDISMLMNEAGYSAMTLGNHDFDGGTEELERFIRSSSAPVVAANVSFPENPALQELVKPYVFLNVKGKKVAVIGLVTPDTAFMSAGASQAVFLPVRETLAARLKDVKDEGADVVILLSHLGLEEDRNIAATTDGIDIIAGGHSHSLLTNGDDENKSGGYPAVVKSPDGSDVLIVTAGEYGRHIGILTASFDKDGRIVSYEGDAIRTDASVPPDKDALRLVQSYASEIALTKDRLITVFQTPLLLGKDGMCMEECVAGEFTADTLLAAFPDAGGAMLNGGALRRSVPAGKVTFGDVAELFPFDSSVGTAVMSGSEIRRMLEHGISRFADAGDGGRAFLQTAGISYSFDPSAKPFRRVFDVKVKENGEYVPIKDEKKYKIVMLDFIARGGDGFSPVRRFVPTDRKAADVLMEVWRKERSFSPRPEGRILKRAVD